MTNTATALYQFFSQFLPAYVEGSVPDEAEMPYITYRLAEPNWNSEVQIYARVWYRSTSFAAICQTVDRIKEIAGGGLTLTVNNQLVALIPDEIFSQFTPSDDPLIKMAYLSFTMHVV